VSEAVIKIENLYKEYRLGVIGHGTLYRDIQSWWANILGKEDPNTLIGHSRTKMLNDHILALENLNLEVKKGEILGIIGANGAGKSTLLKILSKVTEPTSGRIKIKGSVSTLLEVGTGFHPELTGRDNIYLNGAINGMNKKEVSKKLDEIVDFAGVEQFLDTPIKRYSSGMYVRLGFAVAAHLETDILVVDEVLAVGDADFRKKAMEKIKDISCDEGRTVLFVSHNMESIGQFCNRVIVLSKGKLVADGLPQDSINKYIGGIYKEASKFGKVEWKNQNTAPGGDIIRLKSVCTKNNKGDICSEFKLRDKIIIQVQFWVLSNDHQICNSIVITCVSSKTHVNSGAFYVLDEYIKGEWGHQNPYKKGLYVSELEIPGDLLNEGIYSIIIDPFIPPADPDSSYQIRKHNALSFEITDNFTSDSARGSFPYDWQRGATGYLIRPKLNFDTKQINEI
jgi:lipopolysaccharide transport system ATP-binding protein